MPSPLWPLLLLAELGGSGAPRQLDVAALSSPRPAVCRGGPQRGGPGVWERVRGAERERYCDLLARGYARLANAPAQALQAAESARQIAGATSSVLVLEGRAAARLGDSARARAAFSRAEADPSAFLDLGALRDYARVASATRDAQHAAKLYRTLASRAELLEGDARAVLYIEAAAHVLVADRAGGEEALAYLGQVGEGAAGPGLSDLVLALSALCLDRGGHADRARLVLAGRKGAQLPAASPDGPVLPPGELSALSALWVESTDPAHARELWDAFLAQAAPDNPWLEHARKRRERVLAPRRGKP